LGTDRSRLLAVLCATALSVHVAAAAQSRIAVSVQDDAGAPVAGARVMLTGLTAALHRVIETDDSGQASFDNLPDGQFTIAAEKAGYARGFFGSAGPAAPVPIVVTPSSQFSATVVIRRVGSLTGQILDHKGAPAVAEVRLLRYIEDSAGARRLQTVATNRSSSNGTYQFAGVAPGEYFVCARATAIPGEMISAPSCFGGGREPSGASVIRVGPGEMASTLNVQFGTEPAARVHGVVTDANGRAAGSTQIHVVSAIDDGFGQATVRTNPAGEFVATLMPGMYYFVIPGGGAIQAMLTPGTTNEVVFSIGRSMTLTGKLSLDAADGGPKPGSGTTIFELVPAEPAYAHLMPKIPVRVTDGEALAFAATGVPAGRYEIRPSAGNGGWVPDSAMAAGRNVLGDGIMVFAGESIADMAVSLVRAGAGVAGRLIDQKDLPVFDRKVLIFPADREQWTAGTSRVRWAQPDSMGRFEIDQLPAGRYLLAVIADATSEAWSSSLLEGLVNEALPVVLKPGERLAQTFRVSLSEELAPGFEILHVIADRLDDHHHRHCEEGSPHAPQPCPEDETGEDRYLIHLCSTAQQ
jgi:hypothetical protein